MPYLIGTDEAGYGPNLGPLVITTTAWEVPSLGKQSDLYRRLSSAISSAPCKTGWGELPIAIADSKLLYKPSQGLELLERGVHACLGLLDHRVCDWRNLWQFLEPSRDCELDRLPWHADGDMPLPLAADEAEIGQLVIALREAIEPTGVRLVRIESRCVFPARFNELTEVHGNKAEALSRTTLSLVAEVLASLPIAPAQIICDKHGGRNRYGPLLQALYPDVLIEVARESREASTYRWGAEPARREIHFVAGGESALPTALASMVSKYLRELSMHAFNLFWRRHLPELRPTAGYPGDSKRFKREIADVQQSLGIEDRVLWRER